MDILISNSEIHSVYHAAIKKYVHVIKKKKKKKEKEKRENKLYVAAIKKYVHVIKKEKKERKKENIFYAEAWR